MATYTHLYNRTENRTANTPKSAIPDCIVLARVHPLQMATTVVLNSEESHHAQLKRTLKK